MPTLSDTTRAQRRQHILTSAWRCFSRDGFHATSMDDIIAATAMSSSAVYRYFGGKKQIIRASAEQGIARARQIFVALLDRDPCPDPTETLTFLVTELHRRTDNPDYDLTRIALQTWAEALRDPVLHHRARRQYIDTLEHITELAQRWRHNGYLPPQADTKAVAATLLSIMPGLIVMHHLGDDLPAHALRTGVALLAAATRTPAPTATPAQQTTPRHLPHRPGIGWRAEPSGAGRGGSGQSGSLLVIRIMSQVLPLIDIAAQYVEDPDIGEVDGPAR